jgi:hypothetical protein
MKTIKIILIFLFAFHILCLFIINFSAFNDFNKENSQKLNLLGEIYLSNFKPSTDSKFIQQTIEIYSNLTGTNRGYEFFSPNVSNSTVKLIFITNTGEELQILKANASELKRSTASIYINSQLFNPKLRDKILKSIAGRLFGLNPNVKKISVFLHFTNHKDLKNSNSNKCKTEIKTVLLSEINKK